MLGGVFAILKIYNYLSTLTTEKNLGYYRCFIIFDGGKQETVDLSVDVYNSMAKAFKQWFGVQQINFDIGLLNGSKLVLNDVTQIEAQYISLDQEVPI